MKKGTPHFTKDYKTLKLKTMSLKISPSIGVARLGNSDAEFMLAPEKIGGLPFDYNMDTGIKGGHVEKFKDNIGLVKRQGQVFKVYDEAGSELVIGENDVVAFHWTVHLANKKAAWYQYTELRGNLLYPNNQYTKAGGGPDDVEVRNSSITGINRKQLIIDAGPRTISGINQRIELDSNNVGLVGDYTTSFPVYPDGPNSINGLPVESLGTICTDANGHLIVFGAYGAAGGIDPLTSYGGSDTWNDDIADGSISCTVEYATENVAIVDRSWLIVGSPDFAPEIVNISTLSDTMYDVAIRTKGLNPAMHDGTDYLDSYLPDYNLEILPILERCRAYQWVANVQSMTAFAYPTVDLSDPETNIEERAAFFAYFRAPNDKSTPQPDQSQGVLFNDPANFDIPKMPMNSGSNSVSNTTVVKFLALDETQYFLMEQWSKSLFVKNGVVPVNTLVDEKDRISVGNCVGLPMSPGIEVTWSVQNPAIYSAAYKISVDTNADNGLDPMRDECDPTNASCQPGDLTKRMACPWQADFFQCTVQYINFDHPSINKAEKTTKTTTVVVESWDEVEGDYRRTQVTESSSKQPLPPSYYSYWWPPQSPWDVLTGEHTLEGQEDSHLPAGQQVNYARGINSFVQMVEHWYALAFIRNNNPETNYPYFTETERNNLLFNYKEVGVGQITGNSDDSDTTIPVFYLEKDREKMAGKSNKARLFANFLEKRAFKAITVTKGGLGLPKSGTRSRR